jgi:hypothetical protein
MGCGTSRVGTGPLGQTIFVAGISLSHQGLDQVIAHTVIHTLFHGGLGSQVLFQGGNIPDENFTVLCGNDGSVRSHHFGGSSSLKGNIVDESSLFNSGNVGGNVGSMKDLSLALQQEEHTVAGDILTGQSSASGNALSSGQLAELLELASSHVAPKLGLVEGFFVGFHGGVAIHQEETDSGRIDAHKDGGPFQGNPEGSFVEGMKGDQSRVSADEENAQVEHVRHQKARGNGDVGEVADPRQGGLGGGVHHDFQWKNRGLLGGDPRQSGASARGGVRENGRHGGLRFARAGDLASQSVAVAVAGARREQTALHRREFRATMAKAMAHDCCSSAGSSAKHHLQKNSVAIQKYKASGNRRSLAGCGAFACLFRCVDEFRS